MNIIVTGATGNLGKAVNASLLKANHMVHAIVSPRDHPEKHDFNGTHIYKADLMNEPEVVHTVKKIYETTQQVEVAIMIVGGFVPGNIKETTLKDFEKMFRLNFVTAYNVARQCFIKMETQKDGGLLIFIGARPALHPGQAKPIDLLIWVFRSLYLLYALKKVCQKEYP